VLVSWEPFDFGLRKANVGIAEAARNRAGTSIAVTRLQVGTAAADAFLTMLAAQQTVTAARAGVERARVTHEVVAALAKNELRPGADESRARAELALAETQVIQAEQAVETARATIAQYLGAPANTIALAPGPLLDLPPVAAPAAELPPDRHPLAVAQNAAVAEVKAREKALDRTYFPRFNLQATSYARGSGVQPDNTTGNAASGLGPNIQNWAVGFTVYFPAFDLPAIHARKTEAVHQQRAEEARYRQVLEDLNGERARAAATLAGARRVAQNTPVQLAAARDTDRQAAARYKAGLATIVELAEAQRLLTQAEIDDSLARLAVWRAELAAAAAAGDLTPLLRSAK
jgi:outer membrane protein TolC